MLLMDCEAACGCYEWSEMNEGNGLSIKQVKVDLTINLNWNEEYEFNYKQYNKMSIEAIGINILNERFVELWIQCGEVIHFAVIMK